MGYDTNEGNTTSRGAPSGHRMPTPSQGLNVMGSSSGKTSPSAPVASCVVLAGGKTKSQDGSGSNVAGPRGSSDYNTKQKTTQSGYMVGADGKKK
jgi:hypothetical protein